MKKVKLLLLIAVFTLKIAGQVNLGYYLPKEISYNPGIPLPSDITGHEVGEWHVTHDKLYFYMLELAESSDRAVWEEYGRSYEGRPLGQLIISSPGNIARLEEIRKEHVNLCDPSLPVKSNFTGMPLFVKLGYGIHGDEASASNASMLVAYYLVAGLGGKIDELLENTVILIDPSLNPDGLQRHSTWVNMYRSMNLNPDKASAEFSQEWPGGRTNHYWFDLNRDYIMLQNPETVGRVDAFFRWFPNINTDHHEMGSSSTFFFQPGVRTRENALVPPANYELVTEIASYHIKYLDKIGSLYFSEERFDDFYLGKGSAYPDIHASVGILFEQAGVEGHLLETAAGRISFPFAIRNQFTVSLSTLEAGLKMKDKLLQYQAGFYRESLSQAKSDQVKGYLFSEPSDNARVARFIENLMIQQVKVYRPARDVTVGGTTYRAENSYYIPLEQKEYRYIKSMFETVNKFEDKTFYDISTWTLPMAFNIPYTPLNDVKGLANLEGPELIAPPFSVGSVEGTRESYAYIFEWKEFYTPGILYELLDAGLNVRVAASDFEIMDEGVLRKFKNGTIMVPAYGQPVDRDELFNLMGKVASEGMIKVYGLMTGHTPGGIDLGSNEFITLDKPGILMFIGGDIGSREAGEIWHLLDTKFNIPVTMVKASDAGSVDLSKYNVIILTGSPGNSELITEKINDWVLNGGTLISMMRGNDFVTAGGLATLEKTAMPMNDPGQSYRYGDRANLASVHNIPGSIFSAKIDITHPLGYGYEREILPVFKTNNDVYEASAGLYSNPVVFTANPLLSGYSSPENISRISGTPYASVNMAGRGRIISFYDNPNFRAIWFGTTKIFMNAIFFGQII